MLDAEERIVAAARRQTAHRVPAWFVDEQLAAGAGRGRALSTEQASLARQFACSGARVMLGLAPAGAGKTTAMRVSVDAWQAAGRPVLAVTLSAVAADVLGRAGEAGAVVQQLAAIEAGE